MKESKILKSISYVIIPFLILIICLSLFYELGKNSFSSKKDDSTYFKSDDFLYSYMMRLADQANNIIYHNDRYRCIYDGNIKICYNDIEEYNYYYYDNGLKDNYYLILYKELALTNVELTVNTDTIEEIKNYIVQRDGQKVNIINGVVEATSELISNKAIQFFDNFKINYYTVIKGDNTTYVVSENEQLMRESSELVEVREEEALNQSTEAKKWYYTKINDFQIFSTYTEEFVESQKDQYYKNLIEDLKPYEKQMVYVIPVASVALVIILVYLVISIGHTKGKDGIDLNDLDRIPIEIIIFVAGGIACLVIGLAIVSLDSISTEYYRIANSLLITVYFVSYILCAVMCVTIIKRIKAKCLIKESLTGKCCQWCWKLIKKFWNMTMNVFTELKRSLDKINKVIKELTESWPEIIKIVMFFSVFIIFSIVVIGIFEFFGVILVSVAIGIAIYKFLENINCYKKIEKHLEEIYKGNYKNILDYREFTPRFQNIVKYINDVSSGFENAIQEGIKSEKLKTELITNVSHDIKTPLTSIINYVDLLKKENIENDKAKEYIEVLENKAQRLKRLTEDLVEASKASSGNVKLNIEKINICELIKQATGEFEDKFKDKNLDVIYTVPKEEIIINADNKYMYRVIENLFSNISKYALESSRVYIDVAKEEKRVRIEIKNISKEKLNISSEELMQRFVRGDKSRTTDGSGLGLSISKSLTELQGGEFKLIIDGDLFKVSLNFEIE